MRDTLLSAPELHEVIDLVASAHEAQSVVLSASRMVDALLDVRAGASIGVLEAIDRALVALAHRTVVTVDEALEMVSDISAAEKATASDR